jgi:hypothetical protein
MSTIEPSWRTISSRLTTVRQAHSIHGDVEDASGVDRAGGQNLGGGGHPYTLDRTDWALGATSVAGLSSNLNTSPA